LRPDAFPRCRICQKCVSGPAGGAYSAPSDPLTGFIGPTSKRRRGGRGAEGRGRERNGGGKGAGASKGTPGDEQNESQKSLGTKIRTLGDKV